MNHIAVWKGVFTWILQTTWQASVVAGLIFLAQRLLRERLSPSWRYGLWLLLVIRLLMPAPPPSAFSIFNLARTVAPVSHEASKSSDAIVPTHITVPPPPGLSLNNSLADDERVVVNRAEPVSAVVRPSAPVSAWRFNWFDFVFYGWLAGVCLFGARLIWANARFRARIVHCQTVTDANVAQLFNDCRAMFRISESVQLIESAEVESPAVYGFWRKWLLLPAGASGRFSAEELRCIFLHEFAHIKRCDLAVNWLVAVLQVLHWFNPVLWLSWRRMGADRELATDALALTHVQESDRAPYGETILKVLEGLTDERPLPGLVGIAESKLEIKERMVAICRPRKSWKWAALAVVLVIAGLGLTRAQTEKAGAADIHRTPSVNLTGHLESSNGKPVQGMVFIWTAGPKVGTSPFCPGCYADCRKSAKTDAKGNFRLESLDPQLKFRLLVAGESSRPKFVEKVDPAKGPLAISLEAQDLAGVMPDRTVRGRVVDAKGVPISAAVVHTRGIKTSEKTDTWGDLKVVDPLAITDAQGRFILTAREAFESLSVWVEARGFAPKAFKGIAGGGRTQELVLTDGVEIKGRILKDGQPLTNATVSAVAERREPGEYSNKLDVGTDAEGHFALLNVPAHTGYAICGRISDSQTYGSTATTNVDTGADGNTVDLGDLSVSMLPTHRINGRVVLSDGQSLPAKTRLFVSKRDIPWTRLVDVSADGQFEASGIPSGPVALSVAVPGYHLSIKNESMDELNPGSLIGRVDHDITNVVVLMDKGPRLQSHFDASSGEPQPEFNPLHGAENAGSRSNQREISGRLTDAQTGEAISHFRVTPGKLDGANTHLDWNPNLGVEGSNGNYTVGINKPPGPIELIFEADGYLPATTPPLPSQTEHYDFKLNRGGGPAGTVLRPDGNPAAGIEVLLTCSHAQNLFLLDGGKFQKYETEELLTTTDAAGHFSLAAQFDMKAIVAAGEAGYKLVPIESFQSNTQITLEHWATIKGVLHRPSGPGAHEKLGLSFARNSAAYSLLLGVGATTDDKGAFEFDYIPPCDCEIQTQVIQEEDAGDTEDLKAVHIAPGQTTEVTIEAPAKTEPHMLRQAVGWSGGRSDLDPVKFSLHGTVLTPDGKPAAEVEVGVKTPKQIMHVGDGALEAGPMNDSVVRTEADGSFTVPMRDSATAMYVVGEAGFARVPRDQWTNGVTIVLQTWGRVEGQLRLNHQPAPNQIVELREDEDFQLQQYEGCVKCTTVTDDKGRFLFTHAPPGDLLVSRREPLANNSWTYRILSYFPVREGETTHLAVGGEGRPVLGKLVVENQKDVPGNSFIDVNIYPHNLRGLLSQSNSVWVTSFKSRWEKRKRLAMKSSAASVSADGAFVVDDVEPGTYELDFTVRNWERNQTSYLTSAPRQIVVPPLADEKKCEPFNLGALSIHFTTQEIEWARSKGNQRSLKAGDEAPSFETKAVNGNMLRLEDYRGKFVLLDIRFALPGMDDDRLQSVNNIFGASDHFAIISLCQSLDEDFQKKLAAKSPNHWEQGYFDFKTIHDSYCLQNASFPLIMLIDPAGKIVATGLRGDQIQAAVTQALASK